VATCNDSAPLTPPVKAAVCGLFCSACTVYIGTHEDPVRLRRLATGFGVSEDAIRCDGCRGERRLFYCRDCFMTRCATERGYAFCGECPECPCPELEDFIAERPHRADIRRNLARIAEVGGDVWMAEAAARHTCPECGTLNSAYDLKCRNCGRDPSCAYVEEHRTIIIARLRQDAARRPSD
jgi:hypothetical protein